MRDVLVSCASLILALLSLTSASAQPPGGGKPQFPPGPPPPMGPPPLIMLLQEKSVQTDLKLNAAQNKKISAVMNKQFMAMKQTFNLQPDQRMQKMQEIHKASDQSAEEMLTAEQKKRVKQISLQVQGSQAFINPDVVQELSLTDEQQASIKTIHDDIGKQMGQLFQGKKLPPQMFQKKMTEFKKNADDQVKKLLTSEQSSKWSEMIGTPFRGEVRMMPPMGMPPPGFPPKQ